MIGTRSIHLLDNETSWTNLITKYIETQGWSILIGYVLGKITESKRKREIKKEWVPHRMSQSFSKMLLTLSQPSLANQTMIVRVDSDGFWTIDKKNYDRWHNASLSKLLN